jgi:hypothetical protein
MPPDDSLALFELPPFLVSPMLEACRLGNTALDSAFYDVPRFVEALRRRGEAVSAPADGMKPNAPQGLNLGALKNPEGALLLIDTEQAPYITAFHDVGAFLGSDDLTAQGVDVVTIAGVGSSALGSAALGWNVAAALGRPALAIVPGYGLADVMLQGMGGWFGFGLHDALATKSALQSWLAVVSPRAARLGRRLSDSAPHSVRVNDAPVFRFGCGSSDVLHDLMLARRFAWVVGHSKGALSIGNALHGLPAERTDRLKVVTLGCPIAKAAPGADYHQFLGLYDALGAMNAWGHLPTEVLLTEHTTNTTLPLSMPVDRLVGRLDA